MPITALKNFAVATLASGITNSATSLSVTTGHGARFPAVPFNAVIYNATDYGDAAEAYHAGEAEMVRVTGNASDTLTIERAQESTAAVTHNTGGKTYKIFAGLTAFAMDERVVSFGPRPLVSYNAGTGAVASIDGSSSLLSMASVISTSASGPTRGHIWWSTGTVANGGTDANAIKRGLITRYIDTWRMTVPTLSDGSDTFVIEAGLGRITSTVNPPDDGVFIRISGATVTAVMRSSSTETTADASASAVASTIHRFGIVYTPGVSAKYYMDGVLFATLSTNEPGTTVAMHAFLRLNRSAASGSVVRTVEIADRRGRIFYP